jgi:hypothetical protein
MQMPEAPQIMFMDTEKRHTKKQCIAKSIDIARQAIPELLPIYLTNQACLNDPEKLMQILLDQIEMLYMHEYKIKSFVTYHAMVRDSINNEISQFICRYTIYKTSWLPLIEAQREKTQQWLKNRKSKRS